MRRVTATVFALVVAVLGSCAVADAPAKTMTRCGRGAIRLIAADSQAQVYEASDLPKHIGDGAYACTYGQARSYRLGALQAHALIPASVPSVAAVTLKGPLVAYESYVVGGEERPYKYFVVVRDLRDGRIVHAVPTGTPLETARGEVGVGRVVSLILERGGAAAWIALDNDRSGTGADYFDVEAIERTGTRLIASGTNIAPRSLALGGSTLYWTQGGTPRSARLN